MFLDILMEEWQKPCYVHLIQGHILYVGLGCSHEEADTRLYGTPITFVIP